MLELLVCSLLTILPDYLFRRRCGAESVLIVGSGGPKWLISSLFIHVGGCRLGEFHSRPGYLEDELGPRAWSWCLAFDGGRNAGFQGFRRDQSSDRKRSWGE